MVCISNPSTTQIHALKRLALSVSNMVAAVASLACISGWNQQHWNPSDSRFVVGEKPQLIESPVVMLPALLRTFDLGTLSDSGQIFKRNTGTDCLRFLYQLFRDVMVQRLKFFLEFSELHPKKLSILGRKVNIPVNQKFSLSFFNYQIGCNFFKECNALPIPRNNPRVSRFRPKPTFTRALNVGTSGKSLIQPIKKFSAGVSNLNVDGVNRLCFSFRLPSSQHDTAFTINYACQVAFFGLRKVGNQATFKWLTHLKGSSRGASFQSQLERSHPDGLPRISFRKHQHQFLFGCGGVMLPQDLIFLFREILLTAQWCFDNVNTMILAFSLSRNQFLKEFSLPESLLSNHPERKRLKPLFVFPLSSKETEFPNAQESL